MYKAINKKTPSWASFGLLFYIWEVINKAVRTALADVILMCMVNVNILNTTTTEMYLEPYQTSEMEVFAKIVNG